MLASVLRLSGLDQRLAAFKLRLDEKAYEAVDKHLCPVWRCQPNFFRVKTAGR
jgi:hypothetical protein